MQTQLGGLGLSGDALSEILKGTNADISGMIARREINQYASRFAPYQALSSQAYSQAGQLTFGAAEAAAAKDAARMADALDRANLALATANVRLEQVEKHLARMQDAPERTAAAVRRSVDQLATRGHRDKIASGRR